MVSELLKERTGNNRPRWLRMDELPFSRVTGYRLIDRGDIVSVLINARPGNGRRGTKKGIRLVDADSLDAYLERLAVEQQAAKVHEVA
jgi:hypothetical protein